MNRACRYIGMSRQAYYKARQSQRERTQQTRQVLELVHAQRLRQPRLGTRKLHYLLSPALQAAGIKLGRDALFDRLREAQLLVAPRRAYHKTTNSHHRFRRHPNLLKAGDGQVTATACEQVKHPGLAPRLQSGDLLADCAC